MTSRKQAGRYGRLVQACVRRVGSVEDARDLVQQAYLRMLEYRFFVEVRDEYALLHRIVLNLAINRFHHEQLLTYVAESVEDLDERVGIVDARPGPDSVVAAQQELEVIESFLSLTSWRTASIFLAQRAGHSYAELSKEFGIAKRTVRKHVARGASLVKALEREPKPVCRPLKRWLEMGRRDHA